MSAKKNYLYRFNSFLARTVYLGWMTLWVSTRKHKQTISELLPEALEQRKEKKDELDSVLKKWAGSSDPELQAISKLLNDGIKLADRFALKALLALGGTFGIIYAIYFILQPRIPRDSQCLIDEDCIAIAEEGSIYDQEYNENSQEYNENSQDYKDLNNSKLTIRIIDPTGNDRLAIHHQGNKVEDICVMGNYIAYKGLVIARFTGGKGNKPLAITFNIEPPTKTVNNETSRTNINNSNPSNSYTDKIAEKSKCITDGNGSPFENEKPLPQNITPEIVKTVLNQIIYRNSKKSEIGMRHLEIKLNDGNRDNKARFLKIALVEKNKPLTLELPNSQVVKENSILNIDGIKITKSNVSNNQEIQYLIVTLEVNFGKITIDEQLIKRLISERMEEEKSDNEKLKTVPPEITGNNTKKVIIRANIDQLSSIINEQKSISYQPINDQGNNIFQEEDILKIRVDDSNSLGQDEPDLIYPPNGKYRVATGDVSISIRPKNAPDILNVPNSVQGNEDTPLPIRGLQFQDPNSKNLVVNFKVRDGIIDVPYKSGAENAAKVSGNRTLSVYVEGTVEEINKQVYYITYQGDEHFYGDDYLTVTVNDNEGYNDVKFINIQVNPVNDGAIILNIGRDKTESVEPPPPPRIENNDNDNATVSGKPGEKNIRSGPGTEYEVLGTANTGTRVRVIDYARNSDNFLWYKIEFRQLGIQGWIAHHLLTLDGQAPSQPRSQPTNRSSTATNATVIGNPPRTKNMRSGAGTNYTIVGTAQIGDRVRIVSSSYDRGGYLWYQVYHPKSGKRGWIAGQLINRD